MRIRNKEILYGLEPEEVYMLVLSENISGFPEHYWDSTDAKDKASSCIKYLVEEYLGWTLQDILDNFNYYTFRQYKLKNMVIKCFNDSFHAALEYTYPEVFKPWHFKSTPHDYWTREKFLEAVKWELEENSKLKRREIKKILCTRFFEERGLVTGFIRYFNGSPLAALNALYFDSFKPLDLKVVPNKYWTEEHLIDEIMEIAFGKDYTLKEMVNVWERRFIEKSRLIFPIAILEEGNIVKALDKAVPNIYVAANIYPNLKVSDYVYNSNLNC